MRAHSIPVVVVVLDNTFGDEPGFSYGVQCILKSFNFRPTSKGIVRCYLVFTFMFVRKLHAANPRVYIMAIGVVEFSREGYKIRKVFA